MAVYKPDMPSFARQVASIMEQTGAEPNLFVFADGPMDQLSQIERLLARYDRARFVPFPENRGAVLTFLAGLQHVLDQPTGLADPPYFAFADQDDIWDEDKLAQSFDALRGSKANAVHTDARLVDSGLRETSTSLFEFERRRCNPGLPGYFFRNNVTGMTLLFDRPTAEMAVSLLDVKPSVWLHDHFIGMLARTRSGLTLLHRSTVSYVQHGGNVVGAQARRRLSFSGSFLTRHGLAGRYLKEGERFVDALLASDWPSPQGRVDLLQLQRLLRRRGLPGFLAIFAERRELRTVGVPLLARLLWSKLFV